VQSPPARRSRVLSAALPLVLTALTALGAAGCKPKPGDRCQKGTTACLDEHTQLACQDGAYIAVPCKGVKGCYPSGNLNVCDVSGNASGDACSTDDEGVGACTARAKSALVCRGGKYEALPCRGPKGCQLAGGSWTCDASVGQEGDSCPGAGSACSVDKKSLLECAGGKFHLKWPCRGPDGCKDAGGGQLFCDFSVAELGDACGSEGAACSVDKKQMLQCKDGKFVLRSHCRGPEGCKDAGERLTCDQSLAEVGDPCDQGDAACRADGKAFLECREGKLAVTQNCRCTSDGSTVACR